MARVRIAPRFRGGGWRVFRGAGQVGTVYRALPACPEDRWMPGWCVWVAGHQEYVCLERDALVRARQLAREMV